MPGTHRKGLARAMMPGYRKGGYVRGYQEGGLVDTAAGSPVTAKPAPEMTQDGPVFQTATQLADRLDGTRPDPLPTYQAPSISAPSINYNPAARSGVNLAPGQANTESLPGMESFSPMARQAADATYQQGYSYLAPHLEQQQNRLNVDLANRGLPLTSEAQMMSRDRLGRQQGQQLSNLALASVLAGRQEQERLARLGIDVFRTRGADLGRMFGERATAYGLEDAASKWRDQFGLQASIANQQSALQAAIADAQAQQAHRAQMFGEHQYQTELPYNELAANLALQQVLEQQSAPYNPAPVPA